MVIFSDLIHLGTLKDACKIKILIDDATFRKLRRLEERQLTTRIPPHYPVLYIVSGPNLPILSILKNQTLIVAHFLHYATHCFYMKIYNISNFHEIFHICLS